MVEPVMISAHRFGAHSAGRSKRGLPVLVWTVDSTHELRYWTTPGRAWMVTTNRPVEALAPGMTTNTRG